MWLKVMIGTRDITRMCFSSNLTGIVANEIEQSFYSVCSYSGIESIKHALRCSLQNYSFSHIYSHSLSQKSLDTLRVVIRAPFTLF